MTEEPEEAEDDPSVLTPEELRIEDERDDAVRKIGENRYVIRPGEDASDDRPDRGDSEVGALDEDDAQAPGSTPSHQDAGEHRASSPASQTQQDAGERSSPSPDSATPRQNAEAPSASSPGSTPSRRDADAAPADPDDAAASSPNVDLDARAVALERTSGRHGIDVVLNTGDDISERRLAADDRVVVFEEFLRWYARQIDPDSPPAATISALLAEADLSE